MSNNTTFESVYAKGQEAAALLAASVSSPVAGLLLVKLHASLAAAEAKLIQAGIITPEDSVAANRHALAVAELALELANEVVSSPASREAFETASATYRAFQQAEQSGAFDKAVVQ